MSATVICPCKHCSQNIEFESAHAGTTVACPHCGADTVLFSPALKEQISNYRRKMPSTELQIAYLKTCYACQGNVSNEAAVCPHCGHPLKASPGWGNIFAVVFKVLVALLAWSVPFGILFAVLRFIL